MSRDEYKGYYDDVYDELYHYGIKGQKWGIRRYQNPDGSLTEEGRRRYGHLGSQEEIDAAIKRDVNRINAEKNVAKKYKGADARLVRRYEKAKKELEKYPQMAQAEITDPKHKKAMMNYVKAVSELAESDKRIQFSMDRLADMTVDEINKEKKQKVGSRAVLGEIIAGPLLAGGMALYAKDNPYSFRRDERDWKDYQDLINKYGDEYDERSSYSDFKAFKNHGKSQYDLIADKLYSDKDFLKSLYKNAKSENPEFFKGMTFKDYLDTDFFDNDFFNAVSDELNKSSAQNKMYKWSKVKSENSGNTSKSSDRWSVQSAWEASKEGQKFFDKMYEEAKAGIPDLTKEQYRNSDLWWNDADNYFDNRWTVESEREKMIKKYT